MSRQWVYHYAGLTEKGTIGRNNEDSYTLPTDIGSDLLRRKGHLFAVADGMGQRQTGNIASQTSVETLRSEYYDKVETLPVDNPQDFIIKVLTEAIKAANENIIARSENVGSTIVAGLLYGNVLAVANVGNSRAYLLRDDDCVF